MTVNMGFNSSWVQFAPGFASGKGAQTEERKATEEVTQTTKKTEFDPYAFSGKSFSFDSQERKII